MVPIIVKLLTSLAVIILLNVFLKRLPVSLLAGATVFAVWAGLPFNTVVSTVSQAVISLSNLTLMLVVYLVMALSSQLKRNGLVDELVLSVRGTFSSKASLAILPAVIGLLPMPGGALFSAPLLDNFDNHPGINQEVKTRINYWFRHVWEYCWPLYPGIILACDIASLELWVIFLIGIPTSAMAVLVGYLVFLTRIPRETEAERIARKKQAAFSFIPFLPVSVVVLSYFLIRFFLPGISSVSSYLPMVISLIISIVTVQVLRPIPPVAWSEIFLSRKMFDMVLLIILVRIYGALIESDINGTALVQLMTEEMQSFGIPALPLIFLLPFITGMTMGISVGFVGASFPVVIALLGTAVPFNMLASTVAFAYVSGFMGTMLSPLHVCLIVTCRYYKSRFVYALRAIIIPAVMMMFYVTGYMFLLRSVL
ncbi:MAG: DUF401 family protein [Spirochaetia bacterium]|nr:DUF401 family protein [Spirochaetia bacterium]